ncbi:MAG TPA: preprotein translocase subunit SecE [Candidatus Moranbacteria bacterium]|nr:preprotein translocase subunit SecE [Candidatus Moranbacteria bacterium]
MNKVLEFIREAKGELMRVNWPNRRQVVNYTSLVVAVSVAMALFLGGLDHAFGYILQKFIIK